MSEQEFHSLTKLWNQGRLPILDGLYTPNGSYSVQINQTASLRILEKFDLDSMLKSDPDWLTEIDITHLCEISDGTGYLCCGEGSYGSEGFFARLDANKNLLWVVYLEESNPFVEITIDRTNATFRSSSGVSITIDLKKGLF